MQSVFPCFINKNVMLVAKGTWTRYGGRINPQEGGVSRIMDNRGPRGKLPMYIDLTHFF
jgi:hypothetical protein